MALLRQVILLAALGAVTGLAANAVSPRPARLGSPVHAAAESGAGACLVDSAAPVPRIGLAEATALCQACTAGFVDARSAREYAAGHISGAVHLPPSGHPDEPELLARLAAFPLVVVYDGEESCRLAESVAHRLTAFGLRDVRVLAGAWPAWAAAGGPGSSGGCAACGHGPEARR